MPQSRLSPMSKGEFIALVAMMFATIAFSIDAMLPAMPEIGKALSPDDLNKAQLVLTTFVLGMGLGTFFTGPLSDAFGRKPVILMGAVLYILGATIGFLSQSLELLLASRILMGLGAAGPRVVAMAVVRDLFKGREMAKVISIAMMIFTLVPAIAPFLGSLIIAAAGWRSVFLAFILFSLVVVLWAGRRLPETLPQHEQRAFRVPLLLEAAKQMFAHPTVRLSILVQSLCMGILFTMLTMVQQVYDVVFDAGDTFPYWFGFVALMSGSASLLNAAVVERIGMRRMITVSLAAQILCSLIVLILVQSSLSTHFLFYVFVAWQTTVFFMVGTTLGNLNALAMEPMGHIAGMAASVIGSISTVIAVCIAIPVGQLFDGSLVPLATGLFLMASLGFGLMLHMGRIDAQVAAAE